MKNRTFGMWIYKRLHDNNRTQEWLIRRARISIGSIQRWRKGESPTLGTFLRVCIVIAKDERSDIFETIIDAIKYSMEDHLA